MTTRVLSGMRPTGKLHLGNYLGAIKQFLELQEAPNTERFYFVADLHAMTTMTGPLNLHATTVDVIRQYMACGVDPNLSTMYRQSDIPEIPYLAILLGMVAPMGKLETCTTFKDKVSQLSKVKNASISSGLFTYPVLMAADILSVNANIVPVGEDQLQHLELARDFSASFNHLFGTNLSSPQAQVLKAIRVPGLDGSGKMGKSDGNTIDLVENPLAIRKKIMSATTDHGPKAGTDVDESGVKHLFLLLKMCSKPEVYQDFLQRYASLDQRFIPQGIHFRCSRNRPAPP